MSRDGDSASCWHREVRVGGHAGPGFRELQIAAGAHQYWCAVQQAAEARTSIGTGGSRGKGLRDGRMPGGVLSPHEVWTLLHYVADIPFVARA